MVWYYGIGPLLYIIREVCLWRASKMKLQLCFLSTAFWIWVLHHNLHESVWSQWKPVNGNWLGIAYTWTCTYTHTSRWIYSTILDTRVVLEIHQVGRYDRGTSKWGNDGERGVLCVQAEVLIQVCLAFWWIYSMIYVITCLHVYLFKSTYSIFSLEKHHWVKTVRYSGT